MNTVISFSCPAYLALRLSDENIPSREKSRWISEAIRMKLDGMNSESVQDVSTRRLMAALLSRDDVDAHLKEELLRRLNQPKN
jgi:hypothetical protein